MKLKHGASIRKIGYASFLPKKIKNEELCFREKDGAQRAGVGDVSSWGDVNWGTPGSRPEEEGAAAQGVGPEGEGVDESEGSAPSETPHQVLGQCHPLGGCLQEWYARRYWGQINQINWIEGLLFKGLHLVMFHYQEFIHASPITIMHININAIDVVEWMRCLTKLATPALKEDCFA